MICGIDEAGRGCVGGSLFVCGICYEEKLIPDLASLPIKDSKKLSKLQRTSIAKALMSHADITYTLVKKTVSEIDSLGLSLCLQRALEEIIASFPEIKHFIYDGHCTFQTQVPASVSLTTQIKGDALIHQISSASILAKHAKDEECKEIDLLYPEYGFLSHSGYCTPQHKRKIMELGYTPYHRRSFQLNFREIRIQNKLEFDTHLHKNLRNKTPHSR